MANKRKTTTAIVAGVTAAALLMGGTFAWTSISQEAKNEAIVDINPGGRLHDDFNGTNKDVYVENFGDTTTGVDIFARIRLDQYFEVGQEAGLNKDSQGERNVKVEIGGVVYDEGTWVTYKPVDDKGNPLETLSNPVQVNDNWQWTLGNGEDNKPYYMPTFNKNKDSLAADINGTYEGKTEGDIVHYDDYVQYDVNSVVPGTEVYDWDEDTKEEDGETVAWDNDGITTNNTTPIDSADVYHKNIATDENGNIVTDEAGNPVALTHTAQQIDYTATIYTMAEWIAAGSPVGPYWVYDTDGWAYWAQPIKPGETTGLLLDKINMSKVPDDNWYYGINVVGQFATAGDIYQFEDMSDAAKELFATVSGSEEIVISGPDTINIGEPTTFTATRNILGATAATQPTFTWTATATDAAGQPIEGISIVDGVLTTEAAVPHGTKITVTAAAGDGTATADGGTTPLLASKTVTAVGVIKLTAANNSTRYQTGTGLTESFTLQILGTDAANGTINWEVADGEGKALSNTTLTTTSEDNTTATLDITTSETAPKIVITVNYKSNDGEVEFSGSYIIRSEEMETTDDLSAAAYAVLTKNGQDDNGNTTYTFSLVRSPDGGGTKYKGEEIVATFSNLETNRFCPWGNNDTRFQSVTYVNIVNPIKPIRTHSWFYNLESCTSIEGLYNLDMSEVTSTGSMFNSCTSLAAIDIGSWNVENVTDMSSMFYNCENLTSIGDVSGWNTSKVTNMVQMFTLCEKLSADCSTWDVSNVTNNGNFNAVANGVKAPTWPENLIE